MKRQEENSALMTRFLTNNSVSVSPDRRVDLSVHHTDPSYIPPVQDAPASRKRFKNKIIFKRKLILLGYQEVGKTSLRKCFESEPFFFKRLPEVRTTTGVEVLAHNAHVDGDDLELIISDFAGQESYHSHTYFLTKRSIFALVWKVSAVEQDFHSTGINAQEEERLIHWMSEVYSKFPQARLVIIATHLDELRVQGQRSVEMILSKVEKKVRGFLNKVTPDRKAKDCIVGNFAVSCKTRQVIAAGEKHKHLSGEKISYLLQYLTQVAREDCMFDRDYPSAAIPGRHAKLMEDIQQLKVKFPTKLIMPIGELVHMAARVGIESDSELLQAARLMHSWDILYILHPHRLEDNAFILLHPSWLSRMSASLFSYAHVLRTPLHLRSFIGGLEYTISHAEQADMYLVRRGYLRWPLARVLFHRPLKEFLKKRPDDSDVMMCLELLQSMELLYPVRTECDEFAILEEETPVDPAVGRPVVSDSCVTRYFVPSLSPYNTPPVLKRLSPLLFHGGLHYRLRFNLLPDELWWRLQCDLHAYIQLVTVHQPVNAMVTDDVQEEEELLTDGFRLKEADDEHNRWRDSLWLAGDQCRLFVCREGRENIDIFVAEATKGTSDVAIQSFHDALANLLLEYEGVQFTSHIGCPTPHCEGYLDEQALQTVAEVTCRVCGKQFPTASILGRTMLVQFPDGLLKEAGELLHCCLSQRSCAFLCEFLRLPYLGPEGRVDPPPSDNQTPKGDDSGSYVEAHAEYLHALDKVVQAALFQSWLKRIEEVKRRQRMMELDSSPVRY
ncbi:hypothetical protein AGDE_01241 [Angomonas deanei]|uniref:Ras family/Ras of Complex, Roc, domain of DAPkinase, putative n=1 Tax=Angomonas deanei TaxID=59799 RepID=A0A7G2C8I3_9TRYP|nr:hypothetical protein AGDE_01241 [Angomonas deanei]CAD2216038.1 Ras family/Ras of Complex, Roc, domain of DAPkinase, putative [Angomonas deanei]|eukprot:EPY42682.1 hypothetical protein AGDE_01241 [Angomonas deanei]